MAHSHTHDHSGDTADLRFAFFINVAFSLLEIVGGLLTNSMAILSDALHDLGDSVSLGLGWYLGHVSERGSDRQYSYGYRRFSLLGALLNALILTGGSVFILVHAIPRLLNPESTYAPGMVGLAVIGVLANGLAAWKLRGGDSMNAEVIGWHLLEDVLGWAAVLVVGLLLLVVDAPWLDPLLSIGITAYILYNVVGSLRDTVRLFLQAVPRDVELQAIEADLRQIAGVQDTFHTHVWSLDGDHIVMTSHLQVAADTSREDCQRIKREAREAVQALQPEHVTLEIVYPDENFSVTKP